jgi:acyl carrier protein
VPSDNEVGPELTDIIVRVLDCDPSDVVPAARLRDLGADSLAMVEIGEGVHQRLGRRVPDDRLDAVRTVQDLRDAVEDPAPARSSSPTSLVPPLLDPSLPPEEVQQRKRRAVSYAAGFVGVGLVIGVVGGFGLAAVGKVLGLGTQDVPKAAPTSAAPTTPTPTPTPTPTAPATTRSAPQPELSITPRQVAAGERMTLSGRLPTADDNAVLQVQTKDGDGGWTDFPVTVQVSDGRGTFQTQIYTTRTGQRQIRLLDRDSGTATPPATVTVG